MWTGRFVAFIYFAGSVLAASPQLTTIQDTLYQANGTKMNATAVITWYSFQASDTTSVGMQSLTVPIVNGAIYVQLVPNTNATPSQPYTVMYQISGDVQYEETWMVPPSATPLRVQDVRTSSTAGVPVGGSPGTGSSSPPSSGDQSTSSPIPESNVTGLVSDLAARPLKGAGYGLSRVAIVDQNGALETVVGNSSDCVYVDGTSGPCFDPTQLPGYSDGETPAGVVDGSNLNFGLAATPAPSQSLQLFRNGMLQKQGFDYTLTGSVVAFPVAAAPQPGDTLVASYRLPPAAVSGTSGNETFGPAGGSSNGVVVFPVFSPQVVCSAAGTSAASVTALSTLGTCTVPANFFGPGDRVEIRFLYSHSGSAGGINGAVLWGASPLWSRSGGVNDAMIAGRADASVTTAATQVNGESYGTVLVQLPFFTAASDSIASSITISFQGSVSAAPDSVSLVNYTVIRYPAVAHP